MRLGLGLSILGSGAASGPTYSAEATALFARMTTPSDTTRKGVIDTLITSLKNAGVWSKLDVLYMMAAADAQAARLEWKGNASDNLAAINSPTFTANSGYTGDGATSYLATGYSPLAASLGASLNSAHIGIFTLTDTANTGWDGGSQNQFLYLKSKSGTASAIAVSTTGTDGVTTSVAPRHLIGNRVSSANAESFANGVKATYGARASSTPGSALDICRLAAAPYSDRKQAVFHVGQGLSSGEGLALYNALLAYLQAIGAA
jgi:hypothetical protein